MYKNVNYGTKIMNEKMVLTIKFSRRSKKNKSAIRWITSSRNKLRPQSRHAGRALFCGA